MARRANPTKRPAMRGLRSGSLSPGSLPRSGSGRPSQYCAQEAGLSSSNEHTSRHILSNDGALRAEVRSKLEVSAG